MHFKARIYKIIPALAVAAAIAGCGDVSINDGINGSDFLVASSVSSGDFHTCAVSDGGVKCWGRGSSGQLGNNSTLAQLIPVLVTGLPDTAVQVASGSRHSCARLQNSQVWCWGENSDGQLGNSTFIGSRVPMQVTGISTASSISAGANHTCARLADGTLRCWGNNVRGQLGNNSTVDATAPVLVTGLSTTASAVAAGGSHTCAVLADGTVRCWGFNSFEQLGNTSLFPGATSRVPVEVTGVTGAQAIAAGANHSCTTVTDPGPRVRCWGDNFSGQLGSSWTIISFPFNFETTSSQALFVNNITTTLGSISAGADHSCAVLTNKTVSCWGENALGQLGNGGIPTISPPAPGASTSATVIPVSASGINSAVQVSAGQFHTCALLSGGRVACWGDNRFGQLGDGTTITRFTPTQVADTPTAGVR